MSASWSPDSKVFICASFDGIMYKTRVQQFDFQFLGNSEVLAWDPSADLFLAVYRYKLTLVVCSGRSLEWFPATREEPGSGQHE
jgi:hypothetical protein